MSVRQQSVASAREHLRATKILFSAMVTGVGMFMIVAVFISQSAEMAAPGLIKYAVDILWGLIPVSLVCVVLARRFLNQGITSAKNSLNPLVDKLTTYRLSLVRYLVICEILALVGIILFMLTGNFAFLLVASALLGFMLAAAPVKRRVAAALELSASEQSELA